MNQHQMTLGPWEIYSDDTLTLSGERHRIAKLHNGSIGYIIVETDHAVIVRGYRDDHTISAIRKPFECFNKLVDEFLNKGFKVQAYAGKK